MYKNQWQQQHQHQHQQQQRKMNTNHQPLALSARKAIHLEPAIPEKWISQQVEELAKPGQYKSPVVGEQMEIYFWNVQKDPLMLLLRCSIKLSEKKLVTPPQMTLQNIVRKDKYDNVSANVLRPQWFFDVLLI